MSSFFTNLYVKLVLRMRLLAFDRDSFRRFGSNQTASLAMQSGLD